MGASRSSELEKRSSVDGYHMFQYPKEETTHGVGYGHHLHPFYYQGNSPLYSCAISGQVEDHYSIPYIHHAEFWKKSDKPRSKSPQNYLRSKSNEPLIPIIHMATQVMTPPSDSYTSPQSTRTDIHKYINPPPRTTTPILDTSSSLQQSSSKRHYTRNQQNLVDFLAMFHIIPHSDDIDFL
ncbi:hypothetical protein L9F63_007517 [Diploptera punctata]|uniref:Uncharacterized protein n=1 Tax=Diploptera punctata TaxID=6984 RepID=A0AAD7Z7W4_DIPPU|nr:hypothetical protein L9F63_007517 [Diploptera punctata]